MTATAVVIDATPFVRRAVRTALEADGIAVVAELDSCRDAADLIVELAPDAVLLDAHLDPDMGSVRAMVRARPEVAVVVLGPDLSPRLALAAVRAGACGFIPKETEPERLPAIVRGAMAGEAAFPRRLVRMLFAEMCRLEQWRLGDRGLSARECEVLDLLADRLSDRRIAESLSISEVTVRRHITSAMRKLDATQRPEAVARYRAGASAEHRH